MDKVELSLAIACSNRVRRALNSRLIKISRLIIDWSTLREIVAVLCSLDPNFIGAMVYISLFTGNRLPNW